MNATIQDVAKEAGVSISTVSRVLNGNYPVKSATKIKVDAAIKKLNYRPNVLARGLIQKKTYTVGILTPSITNLFFTVIINGIQAFLKEKNYLVLTCDTGGDPKQEQEYVTQLLERQVDGIIAIDPRTASIKNEVYQRAALQTAVTLINGFNEGIKLNYVLSDQAVGATEAMEYLLSLGHREIGFIHGPKSYSNDVKAQVYKAVHEKYHMPLNQDYIVPVEKGNSMETLDMSIEAVLHAFTHKKRPTAVFACNDWMALGALYAAQQLGMKVPGELSVIGYDNIAVSKISMPKLTTVDQNMKQLGEAAARQLYESMAGGSTNGYVRIIMDTKLVIRDSCSAVHK